MLERKGKANMLACQSFQPRWFGKYWKTHLNCQMASGLPCSQTNCRHHRTSLERLFWETELTWTWWLFSPERQGGWGDGIWRWDPGDRHWWPRDTLGSPAPGSGVKQILENEDSQRNLGGLRKSNLEEVASASDKCEAPVRQSRAAGERDCSNSRG